MSNLEHYFLESFLLSVIGILLIAIFHHPIKGPKQPKDKRK